MQSCPSFFAALSQCIRDCLRVGLLVSMFLTLTVMLLNSSARAEDGQALQLRDTPSLSSPTQMKSGGLLFKDREGYRTAPVLHTEVHIVVTGMIARTKVKQSFSNPGKIWQEGVYVFPLPETAAVDRMRMRIGERIIEGQIKGKETG